MKKISYICLLLCLIGCNKTVSTHTTSPQITFCADSAYRYIQQQVAFGPRVPGTQAHTECALFLLEKLSDFGAQVVLQQGNMLNYAGENQDVFNVIGRFGESKQNGTILLCAHYDTRPWSDEEEEYDARFTPILGANDGASGVGVLLEVARQIGMIYSDTTKQTYLPAIEIVFFDCEDMGTPEFYTGIQREDTWCLGSQMWANEVVKQQRASLYQFGILLDMVGDPNAVFPKEFYSTQYARDYVAKVWKKAADLGYGRYFIQQDAFPITDDHYYVNTYAGIPCLDIIHYDARTNTGFANWWHTTQDDMQNISTATLQAVGDVVMACVLD